VSIDAAFLVFLRGVNPVGDRSGVQIIGVDRVGCSAFLCWVPLVENVVQAGVIEERWFVMGRAVGGDCCSGACLEVGGALGW
jgi:hypothetical protein